MARKDKKYNLPPEVYDAWLPPEDISIPDWVEKNVRLSEKMSAVPGPLRISRTPYIEGPLRALGSPFIDHVVLVFGRQMGKSSMQYSFMCYVIAQDPGPTTFLLPTRDKCKEIQETKLDPMFRACPEVVKRFPANPDDYTKTRMNFATMVFAMAWAGSEGQTTTRSNRYLFVDEADEIKKNIGENAIDPIRGIRQTMTTFPDHKEIDTSTPTSPDGNIWVELKTCSLVFEYWLKCPHCKTDQILYWENVRFGENHSPVVVEEMAFYECEECHGVITNMDKLRMLPLGNEMQKWRARTTPDPAEQILKNVKAQIENTISLEDTLLNKRIKKIGFHLPKWYSPFGGGTFGVIAKEFLEATKAYEEGEDFGLMRNWRIYNAAHPWLEEGPSKTELELIGNKIDLPAMVCPASSIFLTCGIDPSEGGFYFAVMAWSPIPEGRGLSSHLIHYGMIQDWDELGSFLTNTRYPIQDANKNRAILLSGLDTGGSEYEGADTTMTEAAYLWLRKMRASGVNVFGTKGMSHPMPQRARQTKIEKMPGKQGKPIPGGLILWEINTWAMKDVLWFHLRIESDKPGRFTFHSGTETDYLKHILSEKKVMQKNGKWEWERRGKNHWLDASLIAMTLVENDCYGLQLANRSSGNNARRVVSKGVE